MRTGLLISLLTVLVTSAVSQNLVVSTSGSCANTDNETCVGSRWGNCCSDHGYCGQNSTYCGAGCQSAFGACYDNADQISSDGGCGSNGAICMGSIFGNCCSKTGFCGSTSTYCGTGCQDAYGACGDDASNVTVSTTIAASARPSTTSTRSTTSARVSATSTPATDNTVSTASPTSIPASTGTSAVAQSQSVTATAGFKAGMAVMAVVLAAIVVALVWFFFVHRPHQQRSKATGPSSYHESQGPIIYEKSGVSTFVHAKPSTASSQSELGGFPVSELPANDLTRAALVNERAAAGYEGAYRGH